MFRYCLLACVVVLFTSLHLVARQGTSKDRDALQGTWTVDKLILGGKGAADDLTKKLTQVFDGDKIIFKLDKDTILEGQFTLDPSKDPRQITVTVTGGPDKGQVRQGIYEITGETVRTCFFLGDNPGKRPVNFTSNADQQTVVTELRRKK
jgi:uncharacterized protein (TIGR03067 family)